MNEVRINYYPFIDGLRAFAMIAVLIAHTKVFFNTGSFEGSFFKAITFLGPFGHLGVDIFFVISGFLITGILIQSYKHQINIKVFYINRFFKIVPHCYVVVLVVYLLSPIFKESTYLSSYNSYFLFIQNYQGKLTTLAHLWSLAVEEQFYLFYPLLIWGIFSISKNEIFRRWVLFIVLFGLIVLTIFQRHGEYRSDFLSLKFNSYNVESTLYRLDGLLVGCLLKILEPFYAKLFRFKFLSPIFLLGSFLIFYYFTTILKEGWIIDCWDKYLLTNFATTFLFLSAYLKFLPLNVILENDLVRYLGKISYSTYLWHYPLIFLFSHSTFYVKHPYACFYLYLITTFLMGALAHLTIERFFLKARDSLVVHKIQ